MKLRAILSVILVVAASGAARAYTFEYSFRSTPVSEAIVHISKEHPEINISFIYKELDNYRTSAVIRTDDIYEAIRSAIGNNPVTVTVKGDEIYVEAMQRGKFEYRGKLIGPNGEPVALATVLLLNPGDSTVITHGFSDESGIFKIPCDHREVIAKLSCLGYKTKYCALNSFAAGTIIMEENAINLATVTVEGDLASASSDKTVYIPTQRQKKAAQNATDLLRFMAIPQIKINAMTNAVTDNLGKEVALYINGMAASQEELTGLNTSDVKKVEYLEFPTDPRYKGAQRVVNFIVQEYVYGGYTKANIGEKFLIGTSSQASVFSKFTYGKMSYDLYVGANNYSNRHIGSELSGDYLLSRNNGALTEVTRNERIDGSHFKNNQYPVTFRATYNTQNVQVRNTVGFTHNATPNYDINGKVTIKDTSESESVFTRSNPSTKNSAMYSGSFFFALPKSFSVDITPTFKYTHTNDRLTYIADIDQPIIRNANEDAYNFRIDAYARKQVGKKHSFMLGIDGGQWTNNLKYRGTNQYNDKFTNGFAAGTLGYNYSTSKLSLSSDFGVCWERTDINGEYMPDLYPFIHFNVQYSLSRKHIVSTFFQYATNSPTVSMKADDILQDNEFLYITGNPMLKDTRHITFDLVYTWLQSNRFSMSAYGEYFGDYNRITTIYSPYNEGMAVIRGYQNNGIFTHCRVGAGAKLALFNGKLELYASPEMHFYKSTGMYSCSYNPFIFVGQAIWYFGKFYARGYYSTPERQFWDETNTIYRSRNYYSVAGGWYNNHWNIRLTANNFLNSDWIGSTRIINGNYYKEHRINYGTSFHRMLNLTVTYTFNYGKKVQTGNEIGEQSGTSSGILK